MKFFEIFRFEVNYQLRHVSTWLPFGIFFLFGFITLRIVTLTEGSYLNAPGTIVFFTIFASAIWVVIGGVLPERRGPVTRLPGCIHSFSHLR